MPPRKRRERQTLEILWHGVGIDVQVRALGFGVERCKAEVHMWKLIACSLGCKPQEREIEMLRPYHDRRHWAGQPRPKTCNGSKHTIKHMAVLRTYLGIDHQGCIMGQFAGRRHETMTACFQRLQYRVCIRHPLVLEWRQHVTVCGHRLEQRFK